MPDALMITAVAVRSRRNGRAESSVFSVSETTPSARRSATRDIIQNPNPPSASESTMSRRCTTKGTRDVQAASAP